jgi:hypothetical protein
MSEFVSGISASKLRLYPRLQKHSSSLRLLVWETEFEPQARHSALPRTSLNLPEAHAVQFIPSPPVNPSSHEQSTSLVLAAEEKLFAGHIVHAADPSNTLYCPAAHASQKIPLGLEKPALHKQFSLCSLPATEVISGKQ